MDRNVQDDSLGAVVVDVDVIFGRGAQLVTVFLPVVDGRRKRRDDALKDRVTTARLTHSTIGHQNLRRDCTPTFDSCAYDKYRTRMIYARMIYKIIYYIGL